MRQTKTRKHCDRIARGTSNPRRSRTVDDYARARKSLVKRTRGKTSDIMLKTRQLLAEGVLTETAGPRRARLVAISR
jgi:hypothetical protein